MSEKKTEDRALLMQVPAKKAVGEGSTSVIILRVPWLSYPRAGRSIALLLMAFSDRPTHALVKSQSLKDAADNKQKDKQPDEQEEGADVTTGGGVTWAGPGTRNRTRSGRR